MRIHYPGRFDVSHVSVWYAAAAAIFFLLFPHAINITEAFSINQGWIPIANWSVGLPGRLSFIGDYFLLAWATMPAWLAFAAYTYVKSNPRDTHTVSSFLFTWIVLLLMLAVILFSRFRLGDDVPLWRFQMLELASRSRIAGAIVWSGILFFVFVLAYACLVKAPLDLVRGISKR